MEHSDTLFEYESGYSNARLQGLQDRLESQGTRVQERMIEQRRWVTVWETVYYLPMAFRYLMIKDERPSTETQEGADLFWSKMEVAPHEVTTVEYRKVDR